MADEPKTAPKTIPARPESMPIARLILKPDIAAHINGLGRALQGNAIVANTKHMKCSIAFVPHLRHHRVEVTDPNAKTTVVVRIHESNVVQWEAAIG